MSCLTKLQNKLIYNFLFYQKLFNILILTLCKKETLFLKDNRVISFYVTWGHDTDLFRYIVTFCLKHLHTDLRHTYVLCNKEGSSKTINVFLRLDYKKSVIFYRFFFVHLFNLIFFTARYI